MLSTIKGSARCGRFPFSRFTGGGYTLVEVMTVVLVLGVLAGSFTVVYRGMSYGSPEKEAQRLARWITNLTTISNRTGQSFSLNCPGNVSRNYIEAIWQNSSKTDTYTAAYGCRFNRYSGYDAESLYSPQWTAMVPTLTVKVSRKGAEHYVIVSRHGRVRAGKHPARDG